MGSEINLIQSILWGIIFLTFAIIDIKTWRIPNLLTYPLMAVAFGVSFITGPEWWSVLVGGLVGFIAMLALKAVARDNLGSGDVKLVALAGMVVGWPLVLMVLVATFIAAAVEVLILRHRIGKPHMPFAPAVFFGVVTALFAGPPLILWWTSKISF